MILPVYYPEDLGVEIPDVAKTILISDWVDQQEAITFAHVLLAHRAELLLTSCIKNYNQKSSQSLNHFF